MNGFKSGAAAVWILLAGLSAMIRLGWLSLRSLEGLSLCWFKRWTGFPCPGCGMGHSLLAALGGQWRASFHDHPLGIPVLAFWTLWLVLPAPRLSPRQRFWVETGALGVILAIYALKLSRAA